MPDTGNRPPAAPNDQQAVETKMRRALGLNTQGGAHTPQQRPEQARQRHRFVQDGGVPVVVLNHRTDDSAALKERVTELQSSLEAERTQHANTRRLLSEQQASTQALQTRLAHAELAHHEAIAQERQALVIAQDALLAAQAERRPAARAAYGRELRPEARHTARVESAAPPRTEPVVLGAEQPPKPKRGRPRTRPLPEPKPLRWWTPSFKAKTKA